jgi:putative membrane protein
VEQVFGLHFVVAAVVYSLLGMVILAFSFLVFDWLTPGKLWNEIAVEKNLPLAIALAATTLAVGQIIASAIHG